MDNYTLFESYLSNKLSEKDRLNFESSRKKDTLLEAAFQEHLVTQASLDLLLEEDVKSVIGKLDIEKRAQAQGRKFKWSIISAAAAFALLLVLFTYQRNQSTSIDSYPLLAEYYKAPLDNTTRSGDDPSSSSVIIVMTKAHVLFQAKEYDEAAIKFEEAVSISSGAAQERAEWYLALSLIESEPLRAKDLIKKIANKPAHKKHQEAIKLHEDPRFKMLK